MLYGAVVSRFLKLSFVVLLAYGGMLVLTGWQFAKAPVGFVPQQDKGYLILTVQLQDAASLERTDRVMARLDQMIRGQKDGGALQRGVSKTLAVSGQSLITNASARPIWARCTFCSRTSRTAPAFPQTKCVRNCLSAVRKRFRRH